MEIVFHSQYFSVARTDVMPKWYIAAQGLRATNIVTTINEDLEFVGKFDTKEKWKRFKSDTYNPFTPQERLKRVTAKDKRTAGVSIIPTPVELIVEDEQSVNIKDWIIVTPERFQSEAKYLGDKLLLKVHNNSGNFPQNKVILFSERNITLSVNGQNSRSEERYVINVSSFDKIITIAASEPSGAFYGAQSLLAVLDHGSKQVPKVGVFPFGKFRKVSLILR